MAKNVNSRNQAHTGSEAEWSDSAQNGNMKAKNKTTSKASNSAKNCGKNSASDRMGQDEEE